MFSLEKMTTAIEISRQFRAELYMCGSDIAVTDRIEKNFFAQIAISYIRNTNQFSMVVKKSTMRIFHFLDTWWWIYSDLFRKSIILYNHFFYTVVNRHTFIFKVTSYNFYVSMLFAYLLFSNFFCVNRVTHRWNDVIVLKVIWVQTWTQKFISNRSNIVEMNNYILVESRFLYFGNKLLCKRNITSIH